MDDLIGHEAKAEADLGFERFTATCVRILRRYIDHLGYSTNFTIYDTDDSRERHERGLQKAAD